MPETAGGQVSVLRGNTSLTSKLLPEAQQRIAERWVATRPAYAMGFHSVTNRPLGASLPQTGSGVATEPLPVTGPLHEPSQEESVVGMKKWTGRVLEITGDI